jgi:hypothetical protein
MPSVDTQYGLDASDDPPRASGSESLAPARALRASRDVTQADEHQLERLTDRSPKGFRPLIRWLLRPSSRWPRIPAALLLIGGGVPGVSPTIGAVDAAPRLVSARLGRAAAADLARSCLGLDRASRASLAARYEIRDSMS